LELRDRERRQLTRKLQEAKALRDAAAATGAVALSGREQRRVARLPQLRAARRAVPKLEPTAALAEAQAAWAPARPPCSKFDLAEQYFALAKTYPAPLSCVTFHLRRILKEPLTRYQVAPPAPVPTAAAAPPPPPPGSPPPPPPPPPPPRPRPAPLPPPPNASRDGCRV